MERVLGCQRKKGVKDDSKIFWKNGALGGQDK